MGEYTHSKSRYVQANVIGVFALLGTMFQPAFAQGVGITSSSTVQQLGGEQQRQAGSNGSLIAQSSVLPTDVIPLPASLQRTSSLERVQYNLYRRLPQRLYFNVNVETSFRFETNPYQYPKKRILLSQFQSETAGDALTDDQLTAENSALAKVGNRNAGFRVVPNITVGWALTPYTSVYGNYFLLRDVLLRNHDLSTTAQSLSYGLQRRINLTRGTQLTVDGQFREYYQTHTQPVFDFLPNMTLAQTITPRISAFLSAMLQLRGKRYFQAPTKEIDPFYTFGYFYQRGLWTYTNSGTLVQNFRQPFGHNATIPVDSYSIILDFEIARRLSRRYSAVQTFVRAEPIYNLHSQNRPGLAGTDFRLYWGVRVAFGKSPLSTDIEELRRQLRESEKVSSTSKNSAQ
jgi:hypothetical protein